MFTFPPSKWVGGILYEHGHRLIASSVGLLTIVLAVWLWTADPRRWMRWLGVTALGAVVAQGVLGGLTVLFFLPAPVSTAHAGLAEIFFCLTVSIALFTSPRWIAGYGRTDADPPGVDDGMLRRVATTTTALIFVQILIGATMRHTGAGLAIPTFPLAWGHLIPDHWDPKIAVHFAHRVGALVVTLAILATTAHVWYHAAEPARAHAAGGARRGSGRRADHARRAHGAEPARRRHQQRARRVRRLDVRDLARHHAQELARPLRDAPIGP